MDASCSIFLSDRLRDGLGALFGLRLDLFCAQTGLRLARQSKRSTRQHGVQTYLRSRPEAAFASIPLLSIPHPLLLQMYLSSAM